MGSARAARISDLADLKGRKDDDRKKAALELRAKLFAYRATQAIVEKMIVALSDSLIQDRDERAKAVVSQLLNHPDIKPILADIAPPGAKLQRASAKLLGINSRRGHSS